MDTPVIVYLFVIFFIIALIVDILPFIKIIKTISSLSKISLETIQSASMEDEAKQKVLLANSFAMLKESLKIIAFTAVLAGLLFLWLLLADFIEPLSYDRLTKYMLTYSGIVLSVISFLSYFLVKKLYVRFRV